MKSTNTPKAVVQYSDQSIRDSLIDEIPAALVDKAANTGLGYKFRVVRLRNRSNRNYITHTAARYFLKNGDKIHYKKSSDKIQEIKVVSDTKVKVTAKGKNGKKIEEVLSFFKAQALCESIVSGKKQKTNHSNAWRTRFLFNDKEHGMESLSVRRERIVEQKMADMDA